MNRHLFLSLPLSIHLILNYGLRVFPLARNLGEDLSRFHVILEKLNCNRFLVKKANSSR